MKTKGNMKNYSLQFLNENIKSGLLIIDRQTLLTQDFHTADNKIIVKSRRVGGGFTVGTTFYDLTINHNTTTIPLDEIYAITEKYLRQI